jgi:hypothetical protein
MESLKQYLEQQGEMTFESFVQGARMAGLNPDLWLRAKHAGLIVTEIRNGVHYVRAAAPQEEV